MIDVNMNTMGKPRAPGLPAPAVRRKISLLLWLVRQRRVALGELREAFAVSERTVLRDLQELRAIGQAEGFAIGERDGAGMVSLTEF